MASRNNLSTYCRQISDIVNSRFIDEIRGEYGYLFNLLPICDNPDTDIQRVLSERVGEYQFQHHITVRREFIMEHEVILLSKFFTERIIDYKPINNQNILDELLQQINPDENIDADAGQDEFADAPVPALQNDNIEQVDNIVLNVGDIIVHTDDVNFDNNIEDIDDEENDEVEQMGDINVNVGDFNFEEASNSDAESELGDNEANQDQDYEYNYELPNIEIPTGALNEEQRGELMANTQRVRDILQGNIQNADDLQVISSFRDYVRDLITSLRARAELGNAGVLPTTLDAETVIDMPIEVAAEGETMETTQNTQNAQDAQNAQTTENTEIVADIMELARMDIELNYTENIPVYIEFPKEPVDEAVLNYVGPLISHYSVLRYREGITTVSIDAVLNGNGVYHIHGVDLGSKELIRLLMFLSPTFAYNLTHKKFVDTPLTLDLSPQLKSAFVCNFDGFYGSQTFSDCTLLVSGYKFYTHKIILANESELFKNYYDGVWGQKDNINEPFVIEADAHLFGKILDFVYTRKLSCVNTAEIVDLYAIADVYGFKNLLLAIESVINPIIMVAIKKRLYQDHPKANVDVAVERVNITIADTAVSLPEKTHSSMTDLD